MQIDVVGRSDIVDVAVNLELKVGHQSQAGSVTVRDVHESIHLLALDILS